MRTLLRRRFPKARLNVTVGRRWFWGGATLGQLRREPHQAAEIGRHRGRRSGGDHLHHRQHRPAQGRALHATATSTPRSTQIRDFYGIQPGEIDLPGFPLFGLFNCAMGVTAVIPDMDPSRPAQVDPAKIVEAVDDWNVTQTFGSPAIWNRVGRYCQEHGARLPTVRRVLSAGAPGAGPRARADEGLHPPGGRRPHALRGDRGVAGGFDRRQRSARPKRPPRPAGASGRLRGPQVFRNRVEGHSHRRRARSPRSTGAEPLPPGEIGELIVRGPVVTRRYVTRTEVERLGEDRRRRRGLAPHGRRRAISTSEGGSGSAAAWPIAC